jgi:hypothetical protein
MTRIFPVLASISLTLVLVALAMGLSIGDLYAQPRPTDPTLAWRGRHLLTGTAAALGVVFVESIAVTYFIGTNRWCREVSQTYRLDGTDLEASTRLKRRAFPWCTLGMLTVVAVGALGAASDPGTGRPHTDAVADYHLAAALVGVVLIAWTYYQAWIAIAANQAVIGRIVRQVGQIRAQKGLDVGD